MLRQSVCCALCLFVVASFTNAAEDWPQFRGPNRDDISSDKGLLKKWPKDGPPLLWKARGLGEGYSSIAIAGGKIFTMGDVGDSSYVVALDGKDGTKLWSAKVGEPGGHYKGTRCTPTVDGDRVYALGQFGDLVCLRVADGSEVWRKSLPKDFKGNSGHWHYTESLLVDGDKLVCTPGGKEATLTALDKKSGSVIWKAAVPGGSSAGYSSIVISEAGGIRQYVQLLAAGVVGIDAKSGRFLWKYDKFAGNTANVPTPIVHGDYIFCTAGYSRGGALLKLSAADEGIKVNEEYYKKNALKNRHGGVVLVGDYVYGDLDHNGRPWCARWKTGALVWEKKGGGPGAGSAAVTFADGHLYFRYQNGVVALVEPAPTAKSYKEISTFKPPTVKPPSWSHPVVVGGKLYLREQDNLFCYDIKAK
jgi:outer membrane protein assembly factor BamB